MLKTTITDVAMLQDFLDLSWRFSEASTFAELSAILTERAGHIIGTQNAIVAVLDDSKSIIHVFEGPNSHPNVDTVRFVDLDDHTPLADPIRTPVASHGTTEDFIELYPKVADALNLTRDLRFSLLPLVHQGSTLGSILFRYNDDFEVGEHTRAGEHQFAAMVARQVARIQSDQDLNSHTKQLEQSIEDLEGYASIIAHDLRGPVRRVASFVQLLIRNVGPLDEKTNRYALTIKEQMSQLDQLLLDVLKFSTVLANRTSMQSVDLNTMVGDIVESMEVDLTNIGGRVSFSPLPIVHADPILLTQVFQNIIDNSIKFRKSSEPPKVSVASNLVGRRDRTHWYEISVSDNGIGMDPATSDGAFDMFNRLNPQDGRSGTGAGLALVKRIIELHGGEISLESVPSKGSTFSFTIAGIEEAFDFSEGISSNLH